MKITKQELKKIIYDFNRISNRLMRVDYNDYLITLKKFLSYIESTELIWDFIRDAGEPTYDVAEQIQNASGYNGGLLELGDTEREENTNIYHILKYCTENSVDIPRTLAVSYSLSDKYQDKIQKFNDRVVFLLISNIEAYLTKVGIDMKLDENTKYNITVNDGQVNLATDNAMIQAIQNNEVDIKSLKGLIKGIVSNIDDSISSEERQKIQESLDLIQSELKANTPRKTLVNMALEGLSAVKGSVEFGAAVSTLIQFVHSTFH